MDWRSSIAVGDRVVVDSDNSYFVRGAVGTIGYIAPTSMFRPIKVDFGNGQFDWLNPDELAPPKFH